MEDFDEDDTRASVDGPVSANMTYSDWLKMQPESVQRDILGPARFEMYKRGEPISGFVADGRVMTLKQLREADNAYPEKESPRFTPEFDNFIKDMKEHIVEKNWNDISESAQEQLIGMMKDNGINDMTGSEFLSSIDEIIQKGSIVSHQNINKLLNNIKNFEQDPRLKNLFETGTSNSGIKNKRLRNNWELEISKLDISNNNLECPSNRKEDVETWINNFNDVIGGIQNRPIYGELVPVGVNVYEGDAASIYGDLHIVISDDVRKRTTFTACDSSEYAGSFTTKAASSYNKFYDNYEVSNGFVNLYKKSQGMESSGFAETQVWGGVDLSKGDVKEIVIKKNCYDDYMKKRKGNFSLLLDIFSCYNIPIRIVE